MLLRRQKSVDGKRDKMRKFDKRVVVGTAVSIIGIKRRRKVTEIFNDRKSIKVEGFSGTFSKCHIFGFTNKEEK